MSEIFSEPDDFGPSQASQATTSLAGSLGAQALDALDPKDSLSGMYIGRRLREAHAGGTDLAVGGGGDLDVFSGTSLGDQQAVIDAARAAIPDVSIEDAKARLKQEGLEGQLTLPDQPSMKAPVLDLMVNEAHDRIDREAAIARGPHGFFPGALGTVTSIGAGMIDPVNAAAFSMPVLGEARLGKLIASAGDSMMTRGAVKFGIGAAQGAVGTAALQPADWWLHTQDGQDYTMAQALESVVMGAGMGGAFHAGAGLFGDIRARIKGAPLEGSPQDLLQRGLMTGTHVGSEQLADDGVSIDEVPGYEKPPPAPPHPAAAVVADLPPPAKEDAVHAAMADIIAGRPTRAGEMLEIAADHDPRIAESFDAWHGSPHDFDRFDSSKIGTGEGAQAYGHGLYFAENEGVAKNYSEMSPVTASGAEDLARQTYIGAGEDRKAAAAQLRDFASRNPSPANEKMQIAAAEFLESGAPIASPKLYKVRINADIEHLLDWDKPLNQQTPHVQEALQKAMGEKRWQQFQHSDASTAVRQGFIAFRDEAVSAKLRDAGIPGIKYLDQGSRGGKDGTFAIKAKDGSVVERGIHDENFAAEKAKALGGSYDLETHETRNFVVFDDKHIEITHKNGEPVSIAELRGRPEAQVAAAAQPTIPDLIAAPKPRGRAAAHPDTLSLNEHLASQGGLRPDPELKAIYGSDRGPFIPGFGPLIRKGGMSLDDALSSAKQHGYMFDPHDVDNGAAGAGGRTSHGLTPNDLLDHLDAENRGQRLYKPGHLEATKHDPEQEKHVIMGVLEHELEGAGAKVGDIDPKLLDRTVEIVHKEGISDVMVAYERAIMEDTERYEATADVRQSNAATAELPGWDVPDDAGSAPGDGGDHPADGGQAGRPEQGQGESNGAQPRGDGLGDRAARLANAAADPRWRELADVKPDYDEPEILDESRAADREPEPASTEAPERSLTALETAAADAEAVWRRIEPTLSEKERALVNDVLDQLKLDKDARDKIISDGAACLAGAVG